MDKVDILDDDSTTFVQKLSAVVKLLKGDQVKAMQKDLLAKTKAKSASDLKAMTAEQEKIAIKVLRSYANKAV